MPHSTLYFSCCCLSRIRIGPIIPETRCRISPSQFDPSSSAEVEVGLHRRCPNKGSWLLFIHNSLYTPSGTSSAYLSWPPRTQGSESCGRRLMQGPCSRPRGSGLLRQVSLPQDGQLSFVAPGFGSMTSFFQQTYTSLMVGTGSAHIIGSRLSLSHLVRTATRQEKVAKTIWNSGRTCEKAG